MKSNILSILQLILICPSIKKTLYYKYTAIFFLFLKDGVEDDDEAHIIDPDEGIALYDYYCKQEDPELWEGSREINGTCYHSNENHNEWDILEDDGSFDAFGVLQSDAINLQGSEEIIK